MDVNDAERLLDERRYEDALQAAEAGIDALKDEAAPSMARLRLRRVACRASSWLGVDDAAVRHGLSAAAEAGALGDLLEQAQCANDLAVVHGRRFRHDRALEHLWTAVQLREEAGHEATPSELNNIANIYVLRGRHDEALALYPRAVELDRAAGDEKKTALTLANIGRTHILAGRPELATAVLDEAVARFERAGDLGGVATTLAKLGDAQAALGANDSALAAYRRALDLHAGGHGVRFEPETRALYGRGALQLGDPDTAVEQLQAAVSDVGDAESLSRSGWLEWLSRAYEAQGRAEEALDALRRHVQIAEEADVRATEVATRVRLAELEIGADGPQSVARIRAIDLERTNRALRDEAETMRRLSVTDALTDLPNRRAIDARVREEIERSSRTGRGFVLALLDADDFKSVNDRFGHDVGDEVLIRLARLLESGVRAVDAVARWGGEEFALLLPEADLDAAAVVLERVRVAVHSERWDDLADGLTMSVSGGAVTSSEASDPTELLKIADRRLFAAKRDGRDRIFLRDEPHTD